VVSFVDRRASIFLTRWQIKVLYGLEADLGSASRGLLRPGGPQVFTSLFLTVRMCPGRPRQVRQL